MKTNIYIENMQFVQMGGLLKPANEKAVEFIDAVGHGEVVVLKDIGGRDISFHRAFFGMLSYIHECLPNGFRSQVPKQRFYEWLKMYKGDYEVLFTFKDGTEQIKLDSIAFGNMSQIRFEEYIKEQLAFIYEDVIRPLYDEDTSKKIIVGIENEWEGFLRQL